jgi:hypothetical protein
MKKILILTMAVIFFGVVNIYAGEKSNSSETACNSLYNIIEFISDWDFDGDNRITQYDVAILYGKSESYVNKIYSIIYIQTGLVFYDLDYNGSVDIKDILLMYEKEIIN